MKSADDSKPFSYKMFFSYSAIFIQNGFFLFHHFHTKWVFLIPHELFHAFRNINPSSHPLKICLNFRVGCLTYFHVFLSNRCSCSPVLKTRIMAARALQPLVEKDHVTTVFDDLLTLLPTESLQGSKQNQIHGVLLQVIS